MPTDKEVTSKIPEDRPGSEGERPVALITGVTGQDGTYLAELLLETHSIRTAALLLTHVPERDEAEPWPHR
jgi:GDPmannose 4,6-dehydratase